MGRYPDMDLLDNPLDVICKKSTATTRTLPGREIIRKEFRHRDQKQASRGLWVIEG
ncbi:MAG: hypothetical protein KatS3mg104_1667 [Phycisphaerae bacterium]|jgi:hypothetical protein|nr:MAG: hypothetical protein KatS3mg104_1667 [Phycisphaerae bacterium]